MSDTQGDGAGLSILPFEDENQRRSTEVDATKAEWAHPSGQTQIQVFQAGRLSVLPVPGVDIQAVAAVNHAH